MPGAARRYGPEPRHPQAPSMISERPRFESELQSRQPEAQDRQHCRSCRRDQPPLRRSDSQHPVTNCKRPGLGADLDLLARCYGCARCLHGMENVGGAVVLALGPLGLASLIWSRDDGIAVWRGLSTEERRLHELRPRKPVSIPPRSAPKSSRRACIVAPVVADTGRSMEAGGHRRLSQAHLCPSNAKIQPGDRPAICALGRRAQRTPRPMGLRPRRRQKK